MLPVRLRGATHSIDRAVGEGDDGFFYDAYLVLKHHLPVDTEGDGKDIRACQDLGFIITVEINVC